MKTLRKLMVFVLLISCLLVLTLPATATGHVEYDGLEVSVEMDQESYEAGASMTATIKVTNTNNRSVLIVNFEVSCIPTISTTKVLQMDINQATCI